MMRRVDGKGFCDIISAILSLLYAVVGLSEPKSSSRQKGREKGYVLLVASSMDDDRVRF